MNILLINDWEHYSSTEFLIHLLIKNFKEKGHNVQFLTNPSSMRVRNCIKSFKPDIAHFHLALNKGILPYLIIRKRNIPIVQTLHNYWLICRSTHHYLLKKNKLCTNFSFDRCNECPIYGRGNMPLPEKLYPIFNDFTLVAVSNALKKVYNQFGYSNVITIYNGIPKINIPISDKDYILCIASNKPWKGIEIFNYFKKCIDFNFIRAGVSSGRVDPSENGYISSKELNKLYSESSLVLIPSLWEEPGSLIPLEASRCKKPILGFNIGCLPEYSKKITVPYLSFSDLEDTLKRLINNKNKRIKYGIENYKLYKKHFTDKNMSKKYIELFEEILKC